MKKILQPIVTLMILFALFPIISFAERDIVYEGKSFYIAQETEGQEHYVRTEGEMRRILDILQNGDTVYISEGEYSLTLELIGLTDVSIIGEGNVWFTVEDPFATIISLSNCRNIVLQGINSIHLVEETYCGASVFNIINCRSILINECILNGSGQYAAYVVDSSNIAFTDNFITSCSSSLFDLIGLCYNFDIKNNLMAGNNLYSGFNFSSNTTDISIEHNTIANNFMDHLILSQGETLLGIEFKYNIFSNNHTDSYTHILDQTYNKNLIYEERVRFPGRRHIINRPPEFSNPEQMDYRLKTTSPALNQAENRLALGAYPENELPVEWWNRPVPQMVVLDDYVEITGSNGTNQIDVYPEDAGQLQEIVNQASSHTTIILHEGDYQLSLLIENKEDLTIKASGEVWIMTEVPWENVVTVSYSDNIVLEGINGVHIVEHGYCWGSVYAIQNSNRIRVTGAVMNGSGDIGLRAHTCNNLEINENYISNCTSGGIYLEDSEYCLVSYNAILDCEGWFGVKLQETKNTKILHNTIAYNTILPTINYQDSEAIVANNLFAYNTNENEIQHFSNNWTDYITGNIIWENNMFWEDPSIHLVIRNQPALENRFIESDPHFIQSHFDDINLDYNSPALNAASDGSTIGAYSERNLIPTVQHNPKEIK